MPVNRNRTRYHQRCDAQAGGDALQALAVDLPDRIDFLLLDGAKSLYLNVLHLVEDRLSPGAVIVADIADYCSEYLEFIEASSGYTSMSFTDDVKLAIRNR